VVSFLAGYLATELSEYIEKRIHTQRLSFLRKRKAEAVVLEHRATKEMLQATRCQGSTPVEGAA